MASFEIENTETGAILGVYEGETGADAIRSMLADAGCTDDADPALKAREVDDSIHDWDSEEYGFCAAETPTADDIDDYFTVENILRMFGGTAPSTDDLAAIRAAAHSALDNA